MFIVTLKFSDNKEQASTHMQGHKNWLKQGFDEGVFMLAGSLQPNAGGAIMVHGLTLPELESRVSDDPFVINNVVSAEILEITASMTDERLAFLVG